MKVSVVVPIYNVEKYIRRCLESIQQQTMNDVEIIVVNDCTLDNSMAIVEDLAKDDRRIRIFNYEKNRGPMCARETGYMAATGDYITFCDSDDYMPKDALEVLYNEAIKTEADIVSGNFTYITIDGKEILKRNRLPYGNASEDIYRALLRKDIQHTLCGKLFKASMLKDYNYKTYEHATNGEDGCLFYQVVQHVDKMAQIERSVYYYAQNIESSTQKRYSDNAVKSICLLNQMRVQTVFTHSLSKDLNKYITNVLCSLYAQGYHHDTNLREYIKLYDLRKWVSWHYILRYLNYGQYMQLVVYRLLISIGVKKQK